MSHLYFNEGSDYFGKMKSFTPPFAKHVHVSVADLLHTVFRIENLNSHKSQKQPLEVFCEKKCSLNVTKFTGNSCARGDICKFCKIFNNILFTE